MRNQRFLWITLSAWLGYFVLLGPFLLSAASTELVLIGLFLVPALAYATTFIHRPKEGKKDEPSV